MSRKWTGTQNNKPQLKVYGAGTELWVRWTDVCPIAFISQIFINILGNQTKFTDMRMQRAPVFPAAPTPTVDWLLPVKAYLTASDRPSWRASTDLYIPRMRYRGGDSIITRHG